MHKTIILFAISCVIASVFSATVFGIDVIFRPSSKVELGVKQVMSPETLEPDYAEALIELLADSPKVLSGELLHKVFSDKRFNDSQREQCFLATLLAAAKQPVLTIGNLSTRIQGLTYLKVQHDEPDFGAPEGYDWSCVGNSLIAIKSDTRLADAGYIYILVDGNMSEQQFTAAMQGGEQTQQLASRRIVKIFIESNRAIDKLIVRASSGNK